MIIVLNVFIIILLFALFGYSHSYLASVKIKQKLAAKFGNNIAFYRFAYNIISIFSFYLIYELSPKPDVIIYDLNYPFDIIIFVLQILSFAGLVWTISDIDGKEFLGISQIFRWRKNNYSENDLDEISVLKTNGSYKYSRHPIYLFSILFLLFRPTMSLFYLVFFICIVIYFYVGSYYEEKKLLEKFGTEYYEYKRSVPRIFPTLKKLVTIFGSNKS
ncbi:MAG: isoprenylcysteine carboxylmethyltransferase family protein [Ignavibacteriales bacterium]|nr:isoprenylcysteine carboxylmethyltransferase family protein [Ignavibacteriales bacterium]